MNQGVEGGKTLSEFTSGSFSLGTMEVNNNEFVDLDQYIMDPNTNYFKRTKTQDTMAMTTQEQLRKCVQGGELESLFEYNQEERITKKDLNQ